MKVKGIVRGKSIEFLESVIITDGLEILIDIPDNYFEKKELGRVRRGNWCLER